MSRPTKGDRVKVTSFMLARESDEVGSDTGTVMYVEQGFTEWLPPLGIQLDNGCVDNHKYYRFNYNEVEVLPK